MILFEYSRQRTSAMISSLSQAKNVATRGCISLRLRRESTKRSLSTTSRECCDSRMYLFPRQHLFSEGNNVDFVFYAGQECCDSRMYFFSFGDEEAYGPRSQVKIAELNTREQSDGNWSSFQLAKSTPPQSVIDYAIAPSARMSAVRDVRHDYLHIPDDSVMVRDTFLGMTVRAPMRERVQITLSNS